MNDEIAERVLAARHLCCDEATFTDVCRRVADALGDTTEEREQPYAEMTTPQSSQH